MIVTSRPAFRSASISSEVTCASYDSMTSDTSGSDYSKANIRKRGSSLAPTTPPQTEHPLTGPIKGELVQRVSSPTILEADKEGDNDASTVRSPSMRTYREGDDRKFGGFSGFTSIHQQQQHDQTPTEEAGLVPGPVRVSLTDEGVQASVPSEQNQATQIQVNGQATEDQDTSADVAEKRLSGSRYVEMLDVDVAPEHVRVWLGPPRIRTAIQPSRPLSVSAYNPNARSRQSSGGSTSLFSRPFIKIATALSGSSSTKSPTSGPNSASSAASRTQIILGQQLPAGTSMKTTRSRSTNATSPTSNGWRRSFLGPRPTSRMEQRPKSMQIVPQVVDHDAVVACYDNEEKRWIPAVTEPARRFSMSGESDDNNLSDVAPSFASSLSGSGAAKSGRNRRTSFQRSFTSAGSSVFLPTPREEKDEESAFDFVSGGRGPTTSLTSGMKGIHPRTSSASKEGASNGRFIKMLRRISGQGWKADDQLRRVTSPESLKSDKRMSVASHRAQTPDTTQPSEYFPASNASSRPPASFSSFTSTSVESSSCPPPLPAQANETDLTPPLMFINRTHPHSRSADNVSSLHSVDEEETATPGQLVTPGVTPGIMETNPYVDMGGCGGGERPPVQARSSSLQTVV
ncbi:hypothetical protein QFC22_003819 [Naganishia vaughanmartiniae]|uniref:Uncharacterized protein n=1 Tax=Naganishia vaughanmartiniae TaxID=1424756 RepID=A0ACC2X3H7_9TREE|nr:hypothetical protein QFC22_003819 [Naganishia vaughanmartiniae]